MKRAIIVTSIVLAAGFSAMGQVQQLYTFNGDTEGFQNVAWTNNPGGWGSSTIQQTHTAGNWQMFLTKEFSWGPGGGNANIQTNMQDLTWYGSDAHIAFDVMVDGASFGPNEGWYQFNIVGNSDGSQGWTQIEKLVDTWQNAGQSDLRAWHFDYTFPQMGWEGGDQWFQFYTGANSESTKPVNFYLDNVVVYLYEVPEPSTFTLAGLGVALVTLLRRRR